jgi:Ca-activated chloride channel homolog
MVFSNFTRLALLGPVVLAALTLGRPAPVGAQKAAFKSGVDMVPLTVTVTDAAGRHITGLTSGDFTVFEDGVEQRLSFFASEAVPVDVALVIDASSSMRGDLPLVRKAACGLVRTLRPSDRGVVVELRDTVRISQALTSDQHQIEATIHAVTASGATALYDGLYVMLREFERARGGSSEIRRQVLILISDGVDTRSHLPFEEVIELARRVGVNIYIIALRGPETLVPGSDRARTVLKAEFAMRAFANETGGRAFAPKAASELPAIYDSIAQELANQYELGYVPVKAGGFGEFRRVLVRLAASTSSLARTRSGYYASRTPGFRSDLAAR